MDGDRPITRREDDRLGFAPVADHLARAILELRASEGFVFGIEGKWGSGKSTLINLTIEALRTAGIVAPEVVLFSPWLVGDRDVLLRSLFDELATAAVRIDQVETAAADTALSLVQRLRQNVRDHHWKLKQKERLRNVLGEKLRAFGSVSGTIGKVARAAGAMGVPVKWVATAAERSGEAAKQFLEGGSVSRRKSELVEALRRLSRRIVVFVDDLDRLEPREASEVLRLIRAVADFPNVVYVLSYDAEVLAKTLTTAIQVDDGAAFIEKIVQVSFRVPRPEAFDLRRWFQSEVGKMFAPEFETAIERRGPDEQRLAEVIDIQGGRYLETPRDVVRALNALRLHAVPVRNLVDIADMVWLQLVRIGNPVFYAWVEEYLTEVAAVATGARVTDGAAETMARRLEEILEEEKLNVDRAIIELAEILPGVDPSGGGGLDREPRRVFNNLIGEQSTIPFVASRRLGSPQHYRYYFSFAHPVGALPDEQVQAFIDSAERASVDAIRMLTDFSGATRPQGGTMAEVLIDRLIAWSDRVPEAAVLGIFASFASTMDDIAWTTKAGDFGEHGAWRSATRAVTVLLKRTTGELRRASLNRLFVDGRAVGWLTEILRNEIFSHGHFGDRAQPESEWLLSAAEFADVLATMLRRYRDTPPSELMRVPKLLSVLYAWLQGSGPDEPRRWVQAQTATDAGLLAFLARVRGWAASSTIGIYYPLRRRDLQNFIDVEDALQRVRAISTSANASQADRQLASELLTAFEQAGDE
jgi:predicted KAP-like P-loop ATPase